ncbi:MAG: hypothetical protein AAB909_02285 [Patescibacteria group bacterium]
MSSFETPGIPEVEKNKVREGIIAEVKEYFNSYLADVENSDGEEVEPGVEIGFDAEEVARVKQIVEDMDGNDFSSAYEYLDSEITRMQGIHQVMREEGGMSTGDIEDGRPYLEKVTRLRDSLIIEK